MKDNRPVNLDMMSMQMPLPSIVSITHRASGIFIFAGVAVLLYALSCSLESEASFNAMKQSLSGPLAKFVLWAVWAGFIYHIVAGVRHLIMDMGIGESLEGGHRGAQLTIAVSVVLILAAGIWLW